MDNFYNQDVKKTKICCEVKSCIHHGENDECLASEIKVGPKSACKCHETECATFEERDAF